MSVADDEPITDDELLYRRISVKSKWYDPSTDSLEPQAFAPHKTNDVTGLSVYRAKYKTAEEASRRTPGEWYYVVVLRAGDLREKGMSVEPRPLADDRGHADLPDLKADDYKSDITRERQRMLTNLRLGVEGPFQTPPG